MALKEGLAAAEISNIDMIPGNLLLDGEKVWVADYEWGKVLADYRKIHPFTFGTEAVHYAGGEALAFCRVKEFTVSPLICYDLRFPEPVAYTHLRSDFPLSVLLPGSALPPPLAVSVRSDTQNRFPGKGLERGEEAPGAFRLSAPGQ